MNMRRLYFVIMSLLGTIIALAEGIDRNTALLKAQKFMPGKEFVEGKTLPSARAKAPQKHDAFYVFNAKDGDGFVIVSGDDRTTEILGYSEHGNLDTDSLPENLRWWLDDYARQIEALGTSLVPIRRNANTLPSEPIAPLIKSAWNQNEPYNYMCPDGNYIDYDEPGYNTENRCITGCVATVMAQVMYYWKWPETCPALDSYKLGPYTIKALPATTFKWDKMKNTYEWRETGSSAYAVAELMRYCGQAVQMDYSPNGSGTGLSPSVLASVFQYSPTCHEIRRNSYSTSRWESVIYDELAAKRPVLYSGMNANDEGHQFIVDGYDGNGFFHFNWGWGGLSDNFYVLSLTDPTSEQTLGGSKWTFQYRQEAFVGLKPAEPNEIVLPVLDSQINFLTPTTTYTRASTNSDFVDVSLEGTLNVYNLSESTSPLEIGWGLLQEDDEIIRILDSYFITYPISSSWVYYDTSVSFGAGLADGNYQLHHIYRNASETEWKICENNYGSQLWAEVKGNSMTVRVPNNENYFKVNSITTHEPVVKEKVDVVANVTNTYTKGTVALTVGLWIQKDDSPWKNIMVGYFNEVLYGQTGDIVLSFIPEEAGVYNVKVTVGGMDEAKGTATVKVADADTIPVDGVAYKCIPAYKRAKVVQGGNKDQSNLTVLTMVTCNGVDCKVTAIDDEAFYLWYNISSLTIPEGIETIGNEAFSYMVSLKKLELPASLKKIGMRVISCDDQLTAVVSHIMEPFAVSDNTFCTYESQNYNEITSPATLYVPIGTKAKYEALSGWTRFSNIEEGELKETIVDGLMYSYSTNSNTATVIQDKSYQNFTKVTIPATVSIDGKTYRVTAIGNYAFWGCSDLSSLVLSEGLLSIGNTAFCYTGISEVTLPSTLKTLGETVFNNCPNIKSLVIPEGVETIGYGAFSYMIGLTELVLPSSLREIGENLVNHDEELTTVVSNIKEPFSVSDKTFGNYQWNGGTKQWDLKASPAMLYVPIGTKVKYEAQNGWTWFSNIEEGEPKEIMVNGLKYSYATGGSIATVIQDDSYRELTKVTIPATVGIDGKTYQVESVGNHAFSGCTKLSSLSLSEGLKYIGNNAFRSAGISEVTFPSTLKSLGNSVFNYCSQIKKIVIPESVETIGNYAFAYMDSLTMLELPLSLKEIGEYMIVGDGDLTAVVSHIMEPFAISDNTFVFDDTYRWNEETQQFPDHLPPSPSTLYVPAGTKAKYEALSGWTWFTNIVEGDADTGITLIENKTDSDSWYNLQGVKIYKPQKGVFIKNNRKVVIK